MGNTYTCKCGTENKFNQFTNLHPDNKIVNTCAGCGRKNVVQRGKVIEWGKLDKKEKSA